MVSDEYGGTGGLEVGVGIFEGEGDAGAELHEVFEGAACGPLGDSVVAY